MLHTMAKALLEKETLDGDDIDKIMAQTNGPLENQTSGDKED